MIYIILASIILGLPGLMILLKVFPNCAKWGDARDALVVAVVAFVMLGGAFIWAFFTNWNYLPNDHAHVLSRSGEVFAIKYDDPYFLVQWNPRWDKHTINLRPRSSQFTVREGKNNPVPAGKASVRTLEGNKVWLDAKIRWRPNVDHRNRTDETDQIVRDIFEDYRRHRAEGNNIGDFLWHGVVAVTVREAMEPCARQHLSLQEDGAITDQAHPFISCLLHGSGDIAGIHDRTHMIVVEEITIPEIDEDEPRPVFVTEQGADG